MIVHGYDEMKPFLPAVMMKGSPSIFDDALEVAQDSLAAEILGPDLERQIEGRAADDSRLLKICQRIISQQAFLASIPELDLILTDSGFAVVSNEQMTMASKERVQSLAGNLKAKIDDGKDYLILYLLRTPAYGTWRRSDEFCRLSDGLILTFAEFRDAAVLNNVSAAAYPKTWSDFHALNPALNVALMTDVASYISKDYALEILGRIREKGTFLPSEKKALGFIRTAVCAFAMNDRKTGLDQTLAAVAVMKSRPDDFPTYTDSEEAQALDIGHQDTPIFSLF